MLNSVSLRCLLKAVAGLGSWINADESVHTGFALSSALGKLRHFRAMRGHQDMSLLHVAIIIAAGGDPKKTVAFASRLCGELVGLPEAAGENLQDLRQEVEN